MNYRFDDSKFLPVTILRDSMLNGARTRHTTHNDVMFPPNSKPLAKTAGANSGDYVFTPYHYHEGIEILRIVEGEADIIINNKIVRAGAGDIAVINPFEAHGIYLSDKNAPFERDCFSFQPMYLFPDGRGDELSLFSQLKNIVFDNYIPKESNLDMRLTLDKIIKNADNAADGGAISILSNIMEFYSLAVKRGCYSTSPMEFPVKLEFMTKVSAYVDSNYALAISTVDAAAFCQYTPEHFCRLFKKCFNTTFLEYLNAYRIQKAKNFVDEGNYPIVSELATAFGFANQNHFGNTFKKYTGTLPSSYIKMRKRKENEK